MTTPILNYAVRSPLESRIYSLPSERVRPPFAVHAAPGRRAMRTGVFVGAAIAGGMGLAVGCVVVAVSWLLAAEAQSGELLGAAEWAMRVTTLGVVAGGITGGVAGALLDVAKHMVRRAQYDKPARERMKLA